MCPLQCNHVINPRDQDLWVSLTKMNNQLPATSAPSTALYAVMRKVVTQLTILLKLGPLIPPNEGSNSGAKGGKVHHLSARQAVKIIPNG